MDIALVSTGSPENDIYPDPKYGTSIQIWGLAKKFIERGHSVTIYSSTYGERNQFQTGDIEIVELPRSSIDKFVNGLFTKLFYSRRIAAEIQRNQPDVVFLRERVTGVFPVRTSLPTIYTVISPDAFDFFYEFSVNSHKANTLLFRYKKLIEEYVCRHSDANIVMNERVNDYLSQKGFIPTHLVPIGIRRDDFSAKPVVDRSQRVLFVGRFDDNKRPDWVVQAMSEIDSEYELHLVGSGKQEKALKQQVADSGISDKVTFHGRIHRSQVIELMEASEIVVLPSLFDNSPNVVLEGMASGCTVIASDTSGASFMIEDEITGFLFDRNDISDLTRILRKVTQNTQLQRTVGQRAREYAFAEQNMDTIADRYLDIASDVLL